MLTDTTLQTRTVRPLAPRASLASVVQSWNAGRTEDWAWDNYRHAVLSLAAELRLRRLCEIGGGRDPIFTKDDIRDHGLEIVINDIDAGELAAGPGGYDTACFDIAGDITAELTSGRRYDLMVSRMVMEHVADGEAAWRNIYSLLTPGGVGLAFMPTLYAWPFVVNKLLPDKVAAAIVKAVFPHRRDDTDDPVFPARYSWTYGTPGIMEPMLRRIGFSEIAVLPFWGHGYAKKFPGLKQVDAAFSTLCERADWRLLTSHAYVIVRR